LPLTAAEIERRIAKVTELPTLPEVIKRISMMAEDRSISAAELGELISHDQILSAKILRLVNSPIYGFPGRISSISHAIVLLGFNAVKGLVMGTTVFHSFAKERREMWHHSVGCAILCRQIAKEIGMDDPEEIMVAGLLHDLGKAVLSYVATEDFDKAVLFAEKQHCPIAEAEEMMLGTNHTQAAVWLVQRWHLPDRLIDGIENHHRPMRSRAGKRVAAIVHLGDIMARAMGYGFAGDSEIPRIDAEAFELLNLSWEQLATVVSNADAEYEPTIQLFSLED
jgi:putative nucleotidyltransferase with HDIG domain